MAENHPHTHIHTTNCMGPECRMHREHSFSHIHDNGHTNHTHTPEEGQKIIDLSEVKEEDEGMPRTFYPGME
jgi:hypothetical protein